MKISKIKSGRIFKGSAIFNKTAEDLLCTKPYTINGNAIIREAINKMLTNKIHRLLVISPSSIGKFIPVGIITAIDTLREISI